jgi:HEAT repeat protein/beta-lactamase regulating signal transducer with metallopeptidase domain
MGRISELAMHFLVNSAWQIAAVAVGASLCARLLQNVAARYRHSLWLASLVLCLVLPLWGLFNFDAQRNTPREIGERRAGAVQARESLTSTSDPSPPPAVTGRAEPGSLRLEDLLKTGRQSVVASPSFALWLAIAYMLFFLYRLAGLWRAWLQAQSFRRSAYKRALPTALAAVALRCQEAFGLKRVPLLFSAKATTPATVGAWKPVIILPEGFCETSEETLASILGHEMAHIARRDFALNLACEFLCLPISFHPLAKFVKRQIDRTRELACDDMVTDRLLEPDAYARSLVLVAGALVLPAGQALTLGVFDADILEERIMKLTRTTRRIGARAARLLALGAFSLLCLTSIAISTFSFELRTVGASERSIAVAGNQRANETGVEAQKTGQSDARVQNPDVPPVTRAELERTLNTTSAQDRAAAACSAGKSRAVEAIPMLVRMLGDDTPIQPIKCWEDGRWNPAIESLKQPSPGEQAAIALASMGMPALEPLTNALNDSNPSVRRNAAWAIGELTNMREGDRAGAVPQLVVLLNDSDAWVRMSSARALGEIKDDRATEDLIARLSDGWWRVRKQSAWALGEMKEDRAVETLCHVLVSDAESDVRTTAAWALGEIHDNRAVEPLCNALSDAQPEVRKTAAWALGETKDKRAVEPLCNALRTDAQSEVRKNAAWALGETKDKRAVETLCDVLVSDARAEVRKTTAWALGEIQSSKAVSFLKQALSDPDQDVRKKAEWALSEIEDARSSQ